MENNLTNIFLKKMQQFSLKCLLLAFAGAFSFGGTYFNKYHFALGQASFYFALLALVTSGFRPSNRSIAWIVTFATYCILSSALGCYWGSGICTSRPLTALVSIFFIYYCIEYAAFCTQNNLLAENHIDKYLGFACWITIYGLAFYLAMLIFQQFDFLNQAKQKFLILIEYFSRYGRWRFNGFTQEPSYLGMVLSSLYPIVFMRVYTKLSWSNCILFLGFWACLLLSSSRTGLVTCILLTVVMVSFKPKQLKYLLVFLSIFVITLYMLSLLSSSISSLKDIHILDWFRLGFMGENSTAVRYAHFSAAINLWKSYPILGIGLGQSGYVLPDFYPPWYTLDSPEYALWTSQRFVGGVPTFSFIPKLLAEIGIIGLMILFAFVLRYGRRCLAQIKVDIVARKYFFCFLGFIISSFGIDGYLYFPAWLLLGVLIGRIRQAPFQIN